MILKIQCRLTGTCRVSTQALCVLPAPGGEIEEKSPGEVAIAQVRAETIMLIHSETTEQFKVIDAQYARHRQWEIEVGTMDDTQLNMPETRFVGICVRDQGGC